MSSQILQVLVEGKNQTHEAFRAVHADAKLTSDQIKALFNAGKEDRARLLADIQKTADGISKVGPVVDRTTRETLKWTEAQQRAAQAMAAAHDQALKFNAGFKATGDEIKRTTTNWTEFSRGIAAGAGFGAFTSLQSVVGSTVRVLKDAVAGAIEFEAQLKRIETLTGAQPALVSQWKNEILAMSGEVGKAPKELGDALYYVASAGITGANALDVVRKSAEASAVGLGDTGDIARTVTAAMNAYGQQNLSAARATDILLAAVREGGAEASEFAQSLGRVLPLAAQMGVSLEEVASSIALFTRLGVDANEAVTALRGTLSVMSKSNEQGQKALRELGLSYADLRQEIQEKGLALTLIDLVERFKGNEEALSKVIPNVRALTGVLANAGSQGEAYIDVVKRVTNSHGDLDAAVKKTGETTSQQWERITSALTAFGTQTITAMGQGKELNTVLSDTAGALTVLTKQLQRQGTIDLPIASGGLITFALGMAKITASIREMGAEAMTLPAWLKNRLYGGGGIGPWNTTGPGVPEAPPPVGNPSQDRYFEETLEEQRAYLQAVMENQTIEERLARKHSGELKKIDDDRLRQLRDSQQQLIRNHRELTQSIEKEDKARLAIEKSAVAETLYVATQQREAMEIQSELVLQIITSEIVAEENLRKRQAKERKEALRRHLEDFEAFANVLGAIGQTIGGSVGNIFATAADIIDGFVQRMRDGLYSMVEIAQTAAEIFQGGYAAGRSIGGKGGSPGKGALVGAAQGAATGALVGSVVPGIGTTIGAVAGGVIGGVGGWLGGKKGQEELRAQMAEMRQQLLLTFGGMEALRKQATLLGVDIARAFSTKSPEEFQRIVDSLNTAMADQKKRWEGIQMAIQGVDLMAKGLAETLKRGVTDASREAFTRLGDYAAAVFGQMLLETGNVIGALREMEPILAQLTTLMEDFHLTGSAALQELLGLRQIVIDNADLAQTIEGLNLLMKGLVAAGIQTTELFQGFGKDLASTFDEMIKRGVPAKQALILMQPALQSLWEHQQKFGDITDEATLALIEEARINGLVGENMRSVNDKILQVLLAIATVLKADLPEGLRLVGDEAERQFGRGKAAAEGMGASIYTIRDAADEAAAAIDRAMKKFNQFGGFDTLNRLKDAFRGDGSGGGSVPAVPVTPAGHAVGFGQGGRANWKGGPGVIKGDQIWQVHDGEMGWVIPKGEWQRMGFRSYARGFGGDDFEGRVFGGGGGGTTSDSGAPVGSDPVTVDEFATFADRTASAIESLAGAVETMAGREPVTINAPYSPNVVIQDNSQVKTAEGVEAFNKITIPAVTRALRLGTYGLRAQLTEMIDDRIRASR